MIRPTPGARLSRRGGERLLARGEQATLMSGDRRCRGELLDFSDRDCAVRIVGDALDHWAIRQLRHCTVVFSGREREAALVRIHRKRLPLGHALDIALELRG